MNNYQIVDHEICKTKNVRAPGILEAIAEYLPWPTVEVDIHWTPTKGEALVIDKQTDFRYTVRVL